MLHVAKQVTSSRQRVGILVDTINLHTSAGPSGVCSWCVKTSSSALQTNPSPTPICGLLHNQPTSAWLYFLVNYLDCFTITLHPPSSISSPIIWTVAQPPYILLALFPRPIILTVAQPPYIHQALFPRPIILTVAQPPYSHQALFPR